MENLSQQQETLRYQISDLESQILDKKKKLAEDVEELVAQFAKETGRGITIESNVSFDGDGVLKIGTRAGTYTT